MSRYRESPSYRKAIKRYNKSKKGRSTWERYKKTEKYKAAIKRFNSSPAGRAARKRYYLKLKQRKRLY